MDPLCLKNALKASIMGLEEMSGAFLSIRRLRRDHRRLRGTGGVSQENGAVGFVPAFRDRTTGAVYLSRYSDGRLAPMHVLDGLPAELVIRRATSGRVIAVRGSITAGFVRAGRFYTRTEAAKALTAIKFRKP